MAQSLDSLAALAGGPGASPAALAEHASGGAWIRFAHLQLVNEYLLRAAYGHCPRLIITMPPQHGKSEEVSHYFPAWMMGRFPERRGILASYEAMYARSWGRKARDVIEAVGDSVFGVRVRRDSKAANFWQLEGHLGQMISAGMKGPITGKPADWLIIDDPIKSHAEAMSKARKNDIWDWWRTTGRTRLQRDSFAIVMATRWAKDDLPGRLLAETGEHWEVLNLPAIADRDERLGLSWTRAKGEPLCPELHPLDELLTTKAATRAYWWSALYQGRPTAKAGNFFKRSNFKLADVAPASFERVIRYWDKAATHEDEGDDPDWTTGVKMGLAEGRYWVLDVERFREGPHESRRRRRQVAELDGYDVEIAGEQEGGSSGKEAAEDDVELFAGFAYHTDRVTGSKQLRADSFAAQVEAGNVTVLKRPWTEDYLEELADFPTGAHDDQVDASSGAFRKIALTTVYVGSFERRR